MLFHISDSNGALRFVVEIAVCQVQLQTAL
jgi:hypothetical protein